MSVQYAKEENLGGDNIKQLPVDKEQPNHDEIHIIDTLFKENKNTFQVIIEDSKDAVIVAAIIMAFSMPQIDELIKKFLPITTNSPYILYIVKGASGGILFWLIKYFYLSRSNS